VFRAFNDEDEELFRFPKVLGHVIGPFIRKILLPLRPLRNEGNMVAHGYCYPAYLQGKQVLFCSLEMSEPQVIRRFWQYLFRLLPVWGKVPLPAVCRGGTRPMGRGGPGIQTPGWIVPQPALRQFRTD
jgi:hypothetical protein